MSNMSIKNVRSVEMIISVSYKNKCRADFKSFASNPPMSNELPPSKSSPIPQFRCQMWSYQHNDLDSYLFPFFDILVNGHKWYDWHWLKWLFPLINMIILFTAINILGKHLWCFINSITKMIRTPQVRKHSLCFINSITRMITNPQS